MRPLTSILPNVDLAFVDPSKITKYLLDDAHPDNGGKAEFFRRLGFSAGDPELLRLALIAHAGSNAVDQSFETEFGTKYVIIGPMPSPSGRAPAVFAIWIVRYGETVLRFVTAYPE